MPFIGFFLGNRIGQIITLIVVGSGLFFGWLAIHDNEIWKKATDAFNTKQDALVEQKKQEFEQKTGQINENAERIRRAIEASQQQTHETAKEILKNAEGKGSEQASPYLKSIIKQLDAAYGEKKK